MSFDTKRACRHLKGADPQLGAIVAAVGPFDMQLQAAPSTFVALSEAITYQQLSPKAASTIYGRFCALFGTPLPSPEEVLALQPGQLRQVGLSTAKARAIHELAERSVSGNLPTLDELHALPDSEVIERLSALRGVGTWTAEMFLMFRLGRPDVLPLGDYGLRRGFGLAFLQGRLPVPAEVQARAEAWRPYRTMASWYLWRVAEKRAM